MNNQDLIKFAGIRIAQGHGRYDEVNERDVINLNRFDGPNVRVIWPDNAEAHEVEIEEVEESEGACWTDDEILREIKANS